jgi:RNA recognition motif-containing protein
MTELTLIILKYPCKTMSNILLYFSQNQYYHNNDDIKDEEQNQYEEEGKLKLFIGGLNYLSLKSDIKSYFETFGKVSGCTLLVDKTTGKSRGFAFVTIDDPDGDIKEKILNRKHEINGKIVDVKPAVEGKQREEMLDASKKIFVGGLDPSVKNGT